MDLSANKEVVRRHLEEAINQQKPELWSELMSEEFVLHHPLVAPGRAAYTDAVAALWSGFPNLAVEVLGTGRCPRTRCATTASV
jgi:hypothetical protein